MTMCHFTLLRAYCKRKEMCVAAILPWWLTLVSKRSMRVGRTSKRSMMIGGYSQLNSSSGRVLWHIGKKFKMKLSNFNGWKKCVKMELDLSICMEENICKAIWDAVLSFTHTFRSQITFDLVYIFVTRLWGLFVFVWSLLVLFWNKDTSLVSGPASHHKTDQSLPCSHSLAYFEFSDADPQINISFTLNPTTASCVQAWYWHFLQQYTWPSLIPHKYDQDLACNQQRKKKEKNLTAKYQSTSTV